MTFRLKPRSDCTQRLQSFHLAITPLPAGMSEGIDLEGTDFHSTWFNDLQESLRVVADSEVETLRTNPFDFILADKDSLRLPLRYPSEMAQALSPYLEKPSLREIVDQWTQEVLKESGGGTISFLIALTERIHRRIRKVKREDGVPFSPREVLERREGACRDLTILFMEICRAQGLAAHVSGYTRQDDRLVEGARLGRNLSCRRGWRGLSTLGLAGRSSRCPGANVDPDPSQLRNVSGDRCELSNRLRSGFRLPPKTGSLRSCLRNWPPLSRSGARQGFMAASLLRCPPLEEIGRDRFQAQSEKRRFGKIFFPRAESLQQTSSDLGQLLKGVFKIEVDACFRCLWKGGGFRPSREDRFLFFEGNLRPPQFIPSYLSSKPSSESSRM